MELTVPILVLLIPVALVVGLFVCLCFAVGFVVMMNVYKAGRDPGVDYSNYIGRLLGWVQTTRHIPKMMRLVFVWEYSDVHGQNPIDIEPGTFELRRLRGGSDVTPGSVIVRITRPLRKMQAQDLMEQLGFRPADGKIDGQVHSGG